MNSASYFWAGDGFGSHDRKAMYQDSLYAFVSFDPSGFIKIEGKKSQFMPPTPAGQKHPEASRISASISNKNIQFKYK